MSLQIAKAVASGVLGGALLAVSLSAAQFGSISLNPNSTPPGGGGASELVYHSGSASYGTWYSGLLDTNSSNVAQVNNGFDTVKVKTGALGGQGSPSVVLTYASSHNSTSCEVVAASSNLHPSLACTAHK